MYGIVFGRTVSCVDRGVGDGVQCVVVVHCCNVLLYATGVSQVDVLFAPECGGAC